MSWGWPVPAGVFPEDQLERLRTFPDIGRDDLIRYFTLTRADVAFLDPGRGRGPPDSGGRQALPGAFDDQLSPAVKGVHGGRGSRR